ncbi:polysaccharide deacetylase family protein [Nonomuraea deserti]|uniref:Polysaccharide deacetylase family protein n=1 Tax=Nonomuraea deserti TaxID=1848322 RepID=A0A4R4W5X5_9ACTN|nr:polysaccharide deacetylase family protein [Nonomuraea deserti]TDD11064.1 polysaccharide deacetylase family protein [Nonomuraea deserti]
MWYAGVGWEKDAYELAVLDQAGTAVVPPLRLETVGVRDVVARLVRLAGREPLMCVIDGTNGVVDGHLMAAGLDVYRADGDVAPPRRAFGSPDAVVLAELGRTSGSRLTRIALDSGTLTGLDQRIEEDLDSAALVEAEQVASGRCVPHGRRVHPRVALTFDDGPDPDHTPRLLDLLRHYHVPATFFCLGLHAAAHPRLVARVAEEGHSVGNHTWSHPYLPDLTRQEVLAQVDRTAEVLAGITGQVPTLFRPPFGGRNADVLGWLAQHGQTTVLWDVEAADWALPGASAIAHQVIRDTDFGSVVLLHDGGGDRSQTIEALPLILETLMVSGCRFVPVEDLIDVDDQKERVAPSWTSA